MLIGRFGIKLLYIVFFILTLAIISQAESLSAEYNPWKFNSIFNKPPPDRTIPGPTPPVATHKKKHYEPKESIIKQNNEKDAISNKEDNIERISKDYYEDGRLAKETPYKNGLKEGTQKIYRKNGKINLAITYAKDLPVSGMCYHTNGTKTPLTNAELLNFENGFSIECD